MPRTTKIRRHSGRITPETTIKGKKKEIIDDCLDPQEFWDDWEDYRDGQRDYIRDGKKIKRLDKKLLPPERIALNKKNKILLRRRKKKNEKMLR